MKAPETTARRLSEFEPNFETLGDHSLESMLETAVEFCRIIGVGENPRWLSLLGASGCGKTHLASAITEWARKNVRIYQGEYSVTKTRDIVFIDASNLAAKARQGD